MFCGQQTAGRCAHREQRAGNLSVLLEADLCSLGPPCTARAAFHFLNEKNGVLPQTDSMYAGKKKMLFDTAVFLSVFTPKA